MDILGTKLDVCVTEKLYNYLKKLHNSHIFVSILQKVPIEKKHESGGHPFDLTKGIFKEMNKR